MVNHNPSSNLDNLCENIWINVDLLGFSHIDFDNLGKIEKDQVEEVVYAMMVVLKKNPLEFVNSIPKILYDRVEKKWHCCLDTEK